MYVCICKQVNESAIAAAVRSGARRLDHLVRELEIATCCEQDRDFISRDLLQRILDSEDEYGTGSKPSSV